MATSKENMVNEKLTFRKYQDGDHDWKSYTDKNFQR
jgi:hypothetical protein